MAAMGKKLVGTLKKVLFITSVNAVIGMLFFAVTLLLIGTEARYSNRSGYEHVEKISRFADCMSTGHIQLSLEQARLLGLDSADLERYCRSREMISKEWIEGRTYWDYHYYSQKKLDTPEIRFNDVDYFNSRAVPCSSDEKMPQARMVWMFGGSTMQNMETSDANTIANAFCKNYPGGSSTINVVNLGVGSFNSEMELVKLLNLYKIQIKDKRLLPDVAIFYDGYNDSQRLMIGGSWAGLPPRVSNRLAGAYSNQQSYSKGLYWLTRAFNDAFRDFAGGKRNIVNDAVAVLLQEMEGQSASANSLITESVDWRAESDGLLLTSAAYIYDQKILAAVCKAMDIKCFTVLQPVLALRKAPVGEIESANYGAQEDNGINAVTKRFYDEVRGALGRFENENYHVIDLSELPNSRKYVDLPFFYDFGHTGYYSGNIIGSELSAKVYDLLDGSKVDFVVSN